MGDEAAALEANPERIGDARDLLVDVANSWVLSAADWGEVESLVETVATALDRHDEQAFWLAIEGLEDFDPLRSSIPLGSDESGARPQVRRRLNDIVDRLRPTGAADHARPRCTSGEGTSRDRGDGAGSD